MYECVRLCVCESVSVCVCVCVCVCSPEGNSPKGNACEGSAPGKAIQRTVGAKLPYREGVPQEARPRRLTSAIALRVFGEAPHHGLHGLPQHCGAAGGAGGQRQPGGPGQEQRRRGRCGRRRGRRGARLGCGGGGSGPSHSGPKRSQSAPPAGAHSRLQPLRSQGLHPDRQWSSGPEPASLAS